jgi:hypothetical protein
VKAGWKTDLLGWLLVIGLWAWIVHEMMGLL